jgi:hypothetical protein
VFEQEAKGNVYLLEGHKVMMPPLGPEHGGRASLNITHRYLVIQLLAAEGDNFQIELAIKDKGGVSILADKCAGTQAAYVHGRCKGDCL